MSTHLFPPVMGTALTEFAKRAYSISTRAPICSAWVGAQERTECAHLPVDRPIGVRPRPSRSDTIWELRGTVTAQITPTTRTSTPLQQDYDCKGGRERRHQRRRQQQKDQKSPGRHAARPRQRNDDENKRRVLDNAQQGPNDKVSKKKDALPDEAPTEQRQGPDYGTNGCVSIEIW